MLQFLDFLNLEVHRNRNTGCRVTAILMNGWILPIGGASAVEGLLSMGPTPSSFREKGPFWLTFILDQIATG